MLNQQTLDKLKELKLHGLAAAWAEQQTLTDYAGLGFDERLGLLVDAEWLTRNNARLKRNVKEAHLKLDSACLEDLDYDFSGGQDLIHFMAVAGSTSAL